MHPRDFRLLFYFREVAQAGSIRAGAEALGVKSPVVSKAMRELEELLGVTLMRRTTRALVLTDSGQQVLAEAEAMTRHAGSAMSVGAANRPVRGTLRISAPGELTEGWLPPVLAHYRKQHPDVVLAVEADDSAVDLASTAADLVVRATPILPGQEPREALEPAPVAELSLDLVVAPSHLPPKSNLPEMLEKTGILLADDRAAAEVHARTGDGRIIACTPPVTGRGNDRRTLKAMALRGLGAVLLIRDTVVADVLGGQLTRIRPEFDYGSVAVRLIPVDPQPAPAVAAFIHMFESFNRR